MIFIYDQCYAFRADKKIIYYFYNMSKYVQIIDDFLTENECKQLIEFAEKK